MLGQAQGATSGMLGHMTRNGAKALGCIWGTRYFKTKHFETLGPTSCGSI